MSAVVTRKLQIISTGEKSADVGLKVAFATSDMEHVNQHFGAAQSFVIYRVDPQHIDFVEAAQFGDAEQEIAEDEDKLSVKFDFLKDCVAVYCQAAGSSASRQLMEQGIQPVKVTENSRIDELLTDLRLELASGPSAWLAKAIRQQSTIDMTDNRFADMADDDWSE